MTWFDVLVKVVDRADNVLEDLRTKMGKPARKRLDVVPEPISVPDPFTVPAAKAKAAPAASAAEPPAEKPLGDPTLAAQVFGRRTDPESGRTVQALREAGVDTVFINLDEPKYEPLEKLLIRDNKVYQLPYVYLKGVFVGGHDEILTRVKKGDFDPPAPS